MNAIPLSTPDGTVRGYMCSKCNELHVHGPLKFSKKKADGCCLCRTCSTEIDRAYAYLCEKCDAEESARIKAERKKWEEVYEASLANAKDREAAELLKERMSDISENYYCAGWLSGLEFALWGMVTGGDRSFGFGKVREYEIQELRNLADKAGGWWYWAKDESTNKFCTFDHWARIMKEEKYETK